MAKSNLIWAPNLNEATTSCFSVAALGSPLPVNATNALDATFTDCGWMGSKGFHLSPKRTIKRHQAFGGDTVKTTQTDYQETMKATFYETSPIVMQTLWGVSNVTVGALAGHRTMSVIHMSSLLPRQSFVLTTIDGVKTRRLVIQEGQLVELADLVYLQTDILEYTVTIDAYKPANGTQAVLEYIDEPDVLAGS